MLVLIHQSYAQRFDDTISNYSVRTVVFPAAITIASLVYDHEISTHAYRARTSSDELKTVTHTFSRYGNAMVAGSIALYGIYALGWQDSLALVTTERALIALTLSGSFGTLLKHVCGRERPYNATSASGKWHGPVVTLYPSKRNGKPTSSHTSFPSGHAVASFSVATVFADAYPNTAVPFVSYSLATLITLSRIPEHQHWLSDCIVGAFLGYTGAKLTQRWIHSPLIISIIPSSTHTTMSITLYTTL